MRKQRIRQGLTLIELVVALTLTGLAVTSGYAAFTTLVDRREASSAHSAAVTRAAAVRSTLVSWLANVRLTIEEDNIVFQGIDGTKRLDAGELPDDELTFLTSAPTPVASHGTIVRLHIDRSDDTPEKGLVAELVAWKGTRTERMELVPNAAGLDVHYLSGMIGARRWLPSWVSTTLLPLGAQMSVVATDGDSLPPLFQLPITVSFESGR
jgi:prepilin-type N-terminal cleavage/methylation domain-containing protein